MKFLPSLSTNSVRSLPKLKTTSFIGMEKYFLICNILPKNSFMQPEFEKKILKMPITAAKCTMMFTPSEEKAQTSVKCWELSGGRMTNKISAQQIVDYYEQCEI